MCHGKEHFARKPGSAPEQAGTWPCTPESMESDPEGWEHAEARGPKSGHRQTCLSFRISGQGAHATQTWVSVCCPAQRRGEACSSPHGRHEGGCHGNPGGNVFIHGTRPPGHPLSGDSVPGDPPRCHHSGSRSITGLPLGPPVCTPPGSPRSHVFASVCADNRPWQDSCSKHEGVCH